MDWMTWYNGLAKRSWTLGGNFAMTEQREASATGKKDATPEHEPSKPACPVCGGKLIEIRAKLQCSRCHTINETCCEGGRG
jgi:Zn finger protein HypA/HybF involved in hydrogenase expression